MSSQVLVILRQDGEEEVFFFLLDLFDEEALVMGLDQGLSTSSTGFFEGFCQSTRVIVGQERVKEFLLVSLPDSQVLKDQGGVLSNLELKPLLHVFLKFRRESVCRIFRPWEPPGQVIKSVNLRKLLVVNFLRHEF